MKEYTINTEHSDDIDNIYFADLMLCCFKYSKYLSYEYYWWDVYKKPDNPPVEKILKHEIKDFEKMLTDEARTNWEKVHLIRHSQIQISSVMMRKYFEVNEDTKNFVMSFGSLFSYWSDAVWNMRGDPLKSYNHEPAQNLIFYRSDQSVFFLSESQERYNRVSVNGCGSDLIYDPIELIYWILFFMKHRQREYVGNRLFQGFPQKQRRVFRIFDHNSVIHPFHIQGGDRIAVRIPKSCAFRVFRQRSVYP